ncbi:MAG TPA: hypothetical protein VLM91_06815 [Candidatus Methylomirabilis sp.]|nr:hypothetical protein [Candidatus Methylomirabilis sp.]
MSELKPTQGDVVAVEKQAPELGWRQVVLGAGVFLLVASLFASAGAKGALGRLPLAIACIALVLIVIPAIAGVIDWLSPKKRGEKDAAG